MHEKSNEKSMKKVTEIQMIQIQMICSELANKQTNNAKCSHTWWLNSFIMVWINTNFFTFCIITILTEFFVPHLHLVHIRPSPESSVNNMWKVLLVPNLQPSIHGPLHSDTLWRLPSLGSNCYNQRVQLVEFLFQFLHQGFNGSSTKALSVSTLMSVNRMPK